MISFLFFFITVYIVVLLNIIKEFNMWQYKIVEGVLTEEDLNILGSEGWELVSVHGNGVVYIFKKPLQ